MKTLITAHSGCDGTPDNSMEFVAHALQCGADALEVDVRGKPDGTLYLSHDLTEDDCPLLIQTFQMLRGGSVRINCDLKQPGLEESVLDLARSCGAADLLLFSGKVSVEKMAADPEIRARTLLNVRSIRPEEGGPSIEEQLEGLRETCRACGASIINVDYDMCTDPILDWLREAGIGVSAWTVNDEAAARRLLDHGVYNITSRRPGMVLALRDGSRGAVR